MAREAEERASQLKAALEETRGRSGVVFREDYESELAREQAAERAAVEKAEAADRAAHAAEEATDAARRDKAELEKRYASTLKDAMVETARRGERAR